MRTFIAAFTLGTALFGCGGGSGSESKNKDVVYIDQETQKLVRAPVQPTPAPHPETGKKTLLRAMYCPQCKAWKAIPPDNVAAGNPTVRKCPEHGCPLQLDGPMPGD